MLNGNGTQLRAAWLVSIAVMVAVPAAAASPEAAFTQDMLARIHTLAPSVALEVAGPLTLHVADGPQAGGQINFDRVAAFCEHNDAAACEEQKQKFSTGIAASLVTTDYAVTRERLRVVVRSAQYATEANAELGAGKSGPLVIAPLAAGLDLVLAATTTRPHRTSKRRSPSARSKYWRLCRHCPTPRHSLPL